MQQSWILIVFLAYFLGLMLVSYLTRSKSSVSSNDAFFTGEKQSPWYLVAFGMIGASLSGITFISVPGFVKSTEMGYFQIVLGYFVGYFVVSFVLLPLYYRLNLISVYEYLETRYGKKSYLTGAIYFLISRFIGASIRLLLVAYVLQYFVFDQWGVPIEITAGVSIFLIWLYTNRSGIKTIVWTDSIQTLFMLLSLIVSLVVIAQSLDLHSISDVVNNVNKSEFSTVFNFDDVNDKGYFWKMFFAGMFITIGMTGLDQDMMQKNLTCSNLKDAQKNMVSFSVVLVVVNWLFLALGVLLFIFMAQNSLETPVLDGKERTDLVFPFIALQNDLGIGVGVLFLVGLIAAAFSSADSAMTSLTTSICIDIIDINKKDAQQQYKTRKRVHVVTALILWIVVIAINYLSSASAISILITYAGYTYGPLIGLFFFGILFKNRSIKDELIPILAVVVPILCVLINVYQTYLFDEYKIGAEMIVINAVLMFVALYLGSKRKEFISIKYN